MSTNDLR